MRRQLGVGLGRAMRADKKTPLGSLLPMFGSIKAFRKCRSRFPPAVLRHFREPVLAVHKAGSLNCGPPRSCDAFHIDIVRQGQKALHEI